MDSIELIYNFLKRYNNLIIEELERNYGYDEISNDDLLNTFYLFINSYFLILYDSLINICKSKNKVNLFDFIEYQNNKIKNNYISTGVISTNLFKLECLLNDDLSPVFIYKTAKCSIVSESNCLSLEIEKRISNDEFLNNKKYLEYLLKVLMDIIEKVEKLDKKTKVKIKKV